jgi:hypothetical protein
MASPELAKYFKLTAVRLQNVLDERLDYLYKNEQARVDFEMIDGLIARIETCWESHRSVLEDLALPDYAPEPRVRLACETPGCDARAIKTFYHNSGSEKLLCQMHWPFARGTCVAPGCCSDKSGNSSWCATHGACECDIAMVCSAHKCAAAGCDKVAIPTSPYCIRQRNH